MIKLAPFKSQNHTIISTFIFSKVNNQGVGVSNKIHCGGQCTCTGFRGCKTFKINVAYIAFQSLDPFKTKVFKTIMKIV